MKKFACVAAALLVLSATALGQDEGRQRGDREGARGPRGDRGPSLRQMVERMNETLKFDDQQMEQIDKLLAAQSEQSPDRRAQFEEMRKAMDEGDEDRAAELREQFRAQREDRGARMQEFLDKVEPILHEDQLEAFGQFKERATQREQDRQRRGDQMRMYRELPDVLELTDEQREQYRALMDERRSMMRERMQEGRNSDQEPGEQGEAGEARPERQRPDFEAMQAGFFEDLEEILTDDQKVALADYRAEMDADSRGGRGRENAEELRALVQATRRIPDLTSEQKDSIREITSAAMRESRQLKSKDKEEKAQLTAATKAEIVKLLDEEQVKAFEQNIERMSSASGRRGDREGRGERGQRRPRGEKPADQPDVP